MQPSFSRFVRRALLVAGLAFVLFACGDGGEDGESSDTTSTTVDDDRDGADSTTTTVPAPADADVATLAGALAGGVLDEDAETCVLDEATGDEEIFAAYSLAIGGTQPLTDSQFTDLNTPIGRCLGAELLGANLAVGLALEDVDEAEACLTALFEGPDADAALVGLNAARFNVPIPAPAEDAAIDVFSTCVAAETLAEQLSGAFEQAAQYTSTVERSCVVDAIDALVSTAEYWTARLLTGDEAEIEALEGTVEECAEEAYADLLQEVPDDFEPWAGTGALAAVAPPARADAYDAPPPMTIDPTLAYQATITTADGEIVIDLFPEAAPMAVNSFVNLARDGFYDGTVFHRVLDGFMAQGGDPTGTGGGGPGYQFGDEFDDDLPVDRRGVLAMANSGPDTNGSQFFITFDAADHLTGVHTVFGQLVDGDGVLGDIDLRDPAAPTSRGELIESIVITES